MGDGFVSSLTIRSRGAGPLQRIRKTAGDSMSRWTSCFGSVANKLLISSKRPPRASDQQRHCHSPIFHSDPSLTTSTATINGAVTTATATTQSSVTATRPSDASSFLLLSGTSESLGTPLPWYGSLSPPPRQPSIKVRSRSMEESGRVPLPPPPAMPSQSGLTNEGQYNNNPLRLSLDVEQHIPSSIIYNEPFAIDSRLSISSQDEDDNGHVLNVYTHIID